MLARPIHPQISQAFMERGGQSGGMILRSVLCRDQGCVNSEPSHFGYGVGRAF